MTADMPTVPAGWYDDPKIPGARRYFDGDAWTDKFTPPPDPNAWEAGRTGGPGVKKEKDGSISGVVGVGYTLAVLFPLVGFIIGLTQINKSKHGIWIVLVSVIAFVVWTAILIGAASEPSYQSNYHPAFE